MNFLNFIFGREEDSKKANDKKVGSVSRANLKIEPLEERQMLAVGGLFAQDYAGYVPAGGVSSFDVSIDTQNHSDAVIKFQFETNNSTLTLDRSQIDIEWFDINGVPHKPDSFEVYDDKIDVMVKLQPGTYRVTVRGANELSYGSYTCNAFLPGSNPGTTDPHTVVSGANLLLEAAILQSQGELTTTSASIIASILGRESVMNLVRTDPYLD
ncbi:MAG: hypothetical protein ACRC2T_20950, partial [Thermoguttaceae bacterium]